MESSVIDEICIHGRRVQGVFTYRIGLATGETRIASHYLHNKDVIQHYVIWDDSKSADEWVHEDSLRFL